MRRPALVLAGTAALVWLLLPLLPIGLWAGADRWSFPDALPQDWGTRGWSEARGAGLAEALQRSMLLGIAVAAVATPLGAMVGRLLGWRLTRHPRVVVLALLVPLLLPPFAVSMGLDVIVLRLGVPELVSVVSVLVVFALPYTAYTCAVGYARCSPGIEEQARALGASQRQARRRVTLPAVRSSLVIAALLAFLVGWSDYVVTLLLGGGQLVTAPVLLGAAASGSGNEPAVAALAVATVGPPVLLVAAVLGAIAWSSRHRTADRTSHLDMPAAERITA
ncbi:ABC transporter permease [Nocardioides sp.]|uniref:ABC transporter permease n=1 Tax=Nocardioides sp. TaxID=35761 RepID=UPI0035648C3F